VNPKGTIILLSIEEDPAITARIGRGELSPRERKRKGKFAEKLNRRRTYPALQGVLSEMRGIPPPPKKAAN